MEVVKGQRGKAPTVTTCHAGLSCVPFISSSSSLPEDSVWEIWVERYGYWAVFAAGILEGEVAFILAGYALSRGYLDPAPTFLLGAAGGTLGDSLYFWIGRRYGAHLLKSWRSLRPLRARAILLLRRRGRVTALLVRFAYGLRVALPIAIGAARIRPSTFHPYNALGALCFTALYLGLGAGFGTAVQEVLGRVSPWEPRILAGLLLLGALAWLIREWRLYHSGDGTTSPRR